MKYIILLLIALSLGCGSESVQGKEKDKDPEPPVKEANPGDYQLIKMVDPETEVVCYRIRGDSTLSCVKVSND